MLSWFVCCLCVCGGFVVCFNSGVCGFALLSFVLLVNCVVRCFAAGYLCALFACFVVLLGCFVGYVCVICFAFAGLVFVVWLWYVCCVA